MIVVAFGVMSCTADVEIKARAEDPTGAASSATSSTVLPSTTSVPPATLAPQSPTSSTVEGCDRRSIGEDFGPLLVGYAAENGRLSANPCFGEASEVVVAAWTDLAQITPPQLIAGVTIVAGFDDIRSDTLAFAGPVADDSDEHLIAVGVFSAANDPAELRLTMAHELAHVFTQTSDQIDVAFFANECDTFFNGFGCFQPDAYMTEWIDAFWTVAELETLPSDYSADIAGGERRCSIDPGFPGSYGASHPEEDFAESFSAYVFDVEMPAGFSDRLAFFDTHPEFVAMRQAIRRTGAPIPPGNFDACG